MIKNKLKDIRAAIAALEVEKKKLEKIEQQEVPEQALAELLHEKLCHQNHTDCCSWEYEDWSGTTRQRYLTRCRKLLDYFSMSEVLKTPVEEVAEKTILILTGSEATHATTS